MCIVQDDPTDWEIESAKMHQYYSQTFLNISIASSPNLRTPFLTDRDPIWIPFSFTAQTAVATQRFYARRVPRLYYGSRPDEGGDLFTRAWAFQEAALAPRSIHFARDDLIWECRKDYKGQHAAPTGLACHGSINNLTQLSDCTFAHCATHGKPSY